MNSRDLSNFARELLPTACNLGGDDYRKIGGRSEFRSGFTDERFTYRSAALIFLLRYLNPEDLLASLEALLQVKPQQPSYHSHRHNDEYHLRLSAVLVALSPDNRRRAFEVVIEIRSHVAHRVMERLIPTLPDDLLPQALEYVITHFDNHLLSSVLPGIIPRLSSDAVTLLEPALSRIFDNHSERGLDRGARSRILVALFSRPGVQFDIDTVRPHLVSGVTLDVIACVPADLLEKISHELPTYILRGLSLGYPGDGRWDRLAGKLSPKIVQAVIEESSRCPKQHERIGNLIHLASSLSVEQRISTLARMRASGKKPDYETYDDQHLLEALVPGLPRPISMQLAESVVELILKFPHTFMKVNTAKKLRDLLPTDALARIVEDISAVEPERNTLDAIISLHDSLTPGRGIAYARQLAEDLSVRADKASRDKCSDVLHHLIPLLDTTALPDILVLIERARSQTALATIVPRLQDEHLSLALSLSTRIRGGWSVVKAFAQRRLPQHLRPELFRQALEIVDARQSFAATADFASIVEQIDPELFDKTIDTVLSSPQGGTWRDSERRIYILLGMFFTSRGLADNRLRAGIINALEGIRDPIDHAEILLQLIPFVDPQEAERAFGQTLSMLLQDQIADSWIRAIASRVEMLPRGFVRAALLVPLVSYRLHIDSLLIVRRDNFAHVAADRAEVGPRYFNTAFRSAEDFREISSGESLVWGDAYDLGIQIGTTMFGLGADRFLSLSPECWDDDSTTPLTVTLSTYDFDVPCNTGTIRLPITGSSETMWVRLSPVVHDTNAILHVELFYRGYLLQRKTITAYVRAAMSESQASTQLPQPALSARVTAATTVHITPGTLRLLPERMLNIVVDRGMGGTFIFRYLDRTRADRELIVYDTTLEPMALESAIEAAREQLDGAAEEFSHVIATPNCGSTLLDRWLPRLADVGFSLFRILTEQQTPNDDARSRLAVALQSGAVVQINPVCGVTTIPWNLLYTKPVKLDASRNLICPQRSARGRDCGDCPHASDPYTVCPNGFWGYRYVIEQIPSWVNGERGEPRIVATVVNNTRPLRMNFNVDPRFGLWQQHLQALGMVGDFESPTRTADSLLAKSLREVEEIWKRRGHELEIVYFYCHGKAGNPALILGEDRITSNFIKSCELLWERRPLVILNACVTGRGSPRTYHSLIGDFRDAGASGIVGTECGMPEWFAETYILRLLERFFRCAPLGQSMLELRDEFLEDEKNPLALGYSMYAASEVVLAKSVAVSARSESPQIIR